MSTGFGVKGKDGKYNTLNLTKYKGRSTDPSKPSGTSSYRHGLQSLGKVASTRRVPPPATLPSLKSENLGNDPNVNLVPKDGSGWASSKTESQSQSPAPQSTPEPNQHATTTVSTSTTNVQQVPQAPTPTVSSNRNQSSSAQRESSGIQPTWGASRYVQHGSKVSAVQGGGQGRGITPFSDEFPTLGDTHKEQQDGQSDDKSSEPQYGPGPSLRPQNVASWREGGGRNVTQASPNNDGQSDEAKSTLQNQQQQIPKATQPTYPYDMQGSEMGQNASMGPRQFTQLPTRPPQQGFTQANMMPQYMYGRYPHQHQGMVPPGPGGHAVPPGGRYAVGMQQRMRYPPFNDPRYRNMMMGGPMQQPGSSHGEMGQMRPVIPHSQLKEFEKGERNDELDEDEGGWATMHGEVDYSEKLVFSDDEESNAASRSGKSSLQEHRSDKREHKKDGPPQASQAWAAQQSANMEQHQNMQQWSNAQYYQMYPPSKQPPYDKRLPPQGQMYPAPPMQHPQMYGRHPVTAGQRYPGPMSDMMQHARSSPSGEDMEHRRKSEKEEALERARKRKDEEERRMHLERSVANDDGRSRSFDQLSGDRSRYTHSGSETPDDAREHSPWTGAEASDATGAYKSKQSEIESGEDRRTAWQERPPGDGFGGYTRSVPHPSTSQSGGRNLPPRLVQQRQERLGQRIAGSGQTHDQPWGNQVQPVRPSIMKRERRESEDSEEQHKGSRSRKQSESSQPYSAGRATPDDDRSPYGQEPLRREDRKLYDASRSSENISPSVNNEHRLWEAGPSKPMKRQVSRESSISNDSRRGSSMTHFGRNDTGSRSVTKQGSNHSEKGETKEDYRQQDAVKPRRTDKVKLRDFRVESDQENETSNSRKPDGKSRKSGPRNQSGDSFSNEPRKWNNDKGSKPIATVSPSTTTSTMARSEPRHKDPITQSITRDVVQPQPTEAVRPERNQRHQVGGPDSRRDNRSKNSSNFRERERKHDNRHPDSSDRDSPNYTNKTHKKPADNRSDRVWDSNFHGDAAPEREHRDTRGPPPRRSDKANERQDRHRQNEGRFRKENAKDQRREPRKEYNAEGKGRNSHQPKKSDNFRNEHTPQQSQAAEKAKPQVTESKPPKPAESRQKPIPAPPAKNVWEERKKQMESKVEKNFTTYIPTEEDKKRTLKETAPIKSGEGADKAILDDKPKGRKNNFEDMDYPTKEYTRDDKSDKRPSDRRYRDSYRQPSNRGDRRGSERSTYPNDRYDRRGGRGGRGRSRGTRGRGSAPPAEKFASVPRGRGARRGGRSAMSRSTYDRPRSYSHYKFNDNTDSYEDDDYSSDSDDDSRFTRRRREASTDESFSDTSEADRQKTTVPQKSIPNNSATTVTNDRNEKPESTFTARGEPSRRGRGRGNAGRGRGRSSGAPRGSLPPRNNGGRGRGYDNQPSDDYRMPKNGDRGLSAPGADDRRKNGSRSNEKRKRKPKPEPPPRFKHTNSRRPTSADDRTSGAAAANEQQNIKSDVDTPQPASDVDWETASEDNNPDYRKTQPSDNSKSDAQRSHTNSRSSNQRGRGGKGGMNDRNRGGKASGSRLDSQVYVLHTVNYNNPSAIEGAMRDASSSTQQIKKMDDDKKAKNKELFRRYDLHNYAGVVNVDDLPEVSERVKEADLNLQYDLLNSLLDPSPRSDDVDEEDGFTPVLSKRSLKKKQEKIRKNNKADQQIMEIYRKQKVEQQRQSRQKLLSKVLGGVKSGSSGGSVKQAVPTTTVATINSDIWLDKIDTWDPTEVMKKSSSKPGQDPQVSHDSGVESSVPSSQRNSPGTEAKISFSHFATTMTSTSVITSICNHEVPSVGRNVQHTPDLTTASQTPLPSSNDVINAFLDSSPSAQSPSRINPMGAIGNERVKSVKRSDSVENITSLYHQESNAISFIADDSDQNQGSQSAQTATLFSPEDLRSATYSPFGEQGFKSSDFTESCVSPDSKRDIAVPNYHALGEFPSPTPAPTSASDVSDQLSSKSQPRNAMSKSNFGHIGSMTQPPHSSFNEQVSGDSASNPASTVLGHQMGGAYPNSDPLEDMTLTPQINNNPNVTPSQGPHEPSSIPAPIPMPPTHTPQNKQTLDGDTKNGIRHEINPSASGVASELGSLTPTSPSLDLNLKMESARKAWDNMTESSSASSQPLNSNPNEGHSFHTVTASSSNSMNENPVSRTSISSLSVTKSSEWKPRLSSATSASGGVEDSSWNNNVQPTSANQMKSQEQQDRVQSPVVQSDPSISMHGNGIGNSGSVMATQAHNQPVASQFNNSPYMYLDYPGSQMMQHGQRLTAVQEFAQSLYSATGYSNVSQQHHTPAYNTQTYIASNAAVGSPGVKPTTPGLAVKPNHQQQAPGQAAMRSGIIPGFGATSIPGMAQQTPLGSTQLTIPRPHGGAPSPAQQIYVPLVDQNRMVTQGSSLALASQQLNVAPRAPQSTSFYSHLNQGSGNFYAQQPQSQLRQGPSFQPTAAIHASQQLAYQQSVYQQSVKPATPPNQLGLDHTGNTGMGNLRSYPPIAPPSQRPRSDEYSPYYQTKNSSFSAAANKMLPQQQQQQQQQQHSQAFGGGGGMKAAGMPSSVSYGSKPSHSLYVPPGGSSAAQDHLSSGQQQQQMHKYSMSSGAGKPIMGQLGSDWNAPTSSQLNRPNSVQGLLSRPFSSSDSVYQPVPSMQQQQQQQQQPNYMQQQANKSHDMSATNSGGHPFPMQNQPGQPYNQSPNWNQPKMVSPQASVSHSGAPGILGKAPRNIVPGAVMAQRYPMMPQQYQSNMVSHQPVSGYPGPMPFQMKPMPPSGMKMQQPPSSVAISQYMPDHSSMQPGNYQNQPKPNVKPASKQSTGNSKMPPVPTLVRGAGSNLIGKKPTFMPEEVVKSNQASERASLLQSLSAFFPDNPKKESDDSADWSTQVANSDPLPKRKPGMRHPGVDRRKLASKNNNNDDKGKRSGPIGGGVGGGGAGKGVKRLQKNSNGNGKKDEGSAGDPTAAAASLAASTKKLTLADTRPKVGQIAQIK